MSLCEENLKIYNESDNAFCVLHTSGSTGKPKCTALKHKNMVNFINSNNNLKFNRYVDNVIAINTITFDVFEMDTIFALCTGKRCVLASEEQQFNQDSFEKMMSEYSKCFFWSTPTKMFNYINNSDTKQFLSNISCYMVGGEIVPTELIDVIKRNNPDICIYTVYGPTETLIYSTLTEAGEMSENTVGR